MGVLLSWEKKKVCKLVNSLHRLNQQLKQWNQKFDNVMLDYGFKINECENFVDVKDMASMLCWISV